MTANPEQPVRSWLTAHFPDALPWQVDYVEAVIAARREGQRLVIQRPSRHGQESARAMLKTVWAAVEEHEGSTP